MFFLNFKKKVAILIIKVMIVKKAIVEMKHCLFYTFIVLFQPGFVLFFLWFNNHGQWQSTILAHKFEC